jgi:hypothetical protein
MCAHCAILATFCTLAIVLNTLAHPVQGLKFKPQYGPRKKENQKEVFQNENWG